MNKHEIFDAWAPRDSPWSAWAKPVLFAHLQFDDPLCCPTDMPLLDVSWASAADAGATLIIDLPGPAGVWMGLALATAGYRPVPLYNACPDPNAARWPSPLRPLASSPDNAPSTSPSLASGHSLVDVGPILSALSYAAPRLREIPTPGSAPPVFLLDANRRTARFPPAPGRFDNRSVSFPTDFPSASLLLNRGISRAVLVQDSGSEPQADLAHTLRRWQEAGIGIELKLLTVDGPAAPIVVNRPSAFRSLWHRFLVASGFRRNPLGGFGGMLPEPSAG